MDKLNKEIVQISLFFDEKRRQQPAIIQEDWFVTYKDRTIHKRRVKGHGKMDLSANVLPDGNRQQDYKI